MTSVKLSQSLSSKLAGRLSLSFDTSSLNVLDAVFHDDGPGRGIPALTLVARKLGRSGRLATTEAADTFYNAEVRSFRENLSGSPTGEVTLSLPALGHLLTSPKDIGGIGTFTQTPGSPRPPQPS